MTAAALPLAEPDVIERTFSEEAKAEVKRLITLYPQPRAALLPALRVAEAEFGSVDLGGMKLVAGMLGQPIGSA